jgi:hypothetical protein
MRQKKWLDDTAAAKFGCAKKTPPDLKCLCDNNEKLKKAAEEANSGIRKDCNEAERNLGLKVAADVCACVKQ